MPFDIFPETQARAYAPTGNYGVPQQQMNQPTLVPTNAQPTVVIAPKFFNGNGSDNSTTDAPTSVEPMSYDNLNQQPSIVVKDSAVKSVPTTSSDTQQEPDFSNLVIKKVG